MAEVRQALGVRYKRRLHFDPRACEQVSGYFKTVKTIKIRRTRFGLKIISEKQSMSFVSFHEDFPTYVPANNAAATNAPSNVTMDLSVQAGLNDEFPDLPDLFPTENLFHPENIISAVSLSASEELLDDLNSCI